MTTRLAAAGFLSLTLLAGCATSGPMTDAAALAAPAPALAAEPVLAAGAGYQKPPANILKVMHAPSLPTPVVAPTHDALILVSMQEYPPMSRVAASFVRLAGVRVETKNRSRHDTPGGSGIVPCATNYSLVHIADDAGIAIALPVGCPGRPLWSADGKRFAFQNIADNSVELWIGDGATGELHQVMGAKLNPMFGDAVRWMPDQRTLLVKLAPELGAPPLAPLVPDGPSVQETDGAKGESSTYELRDTLSSSYDESLFDYYGATQLAFIDVTTKIISPIGKIGIYDNLDEAPDGEHFLVEAIHRPYSYETTYQRFPRDVEVWDRSGASIYTVAKLPLADRVPIRGVPAGPRDFSWRATEPATLTWAEALDGGDWNVKVPQRDKLMAAKFPFTSAPVELLRLEQRYDGFFWLEDPRVALVRELDANRHWTHTSIVDIDDPQSKPRALWDLSTDEQYANPGWPVVKQLPNGAYVVEQEGPSIFLFGDGASPDGDRPFLDQLDLRTLKTTRLFRSGKSSYERFIAFTPGTTRAFLSWHQSPTDPPNLFLHKLGAAASAPIAAGEPAFTSEVRAITHIPDATPEVRAIQKRLVKYQRKDGVELSFTLYTPPDYKEGTRVPAILYAYPLDYAQAVTAGEVTGTQEAFTRLRDYRLLLLGGYAIIDEAAFPIVGDPKKAYDTYLEQLIADAQAAVDKAVELGVVDPERIGVTGHSHGALMTVNLLAHSDLFRAGVATSGSYNKTLTPFGFQNERRSVWAAPEVYLKVSPFFYADKLKTPLLIVHGADDANPGTRPLQATKLYEAIRGNGGTARLVMLPHEPHWYTAMESNEQLAFEELRWFDKYVKNAAPRAGK